MADYLRQGGIGKPKHYLERKGTWKKLVREDFLNHLAATCSVKLSCEAVGMGIPGAYALRRRDAAFAAQWRAALLTGYDRLEAALLEHATRALTLIELGEVPEMPFDPEAALRIIGMYATRLAKTERGSGGPPVKRATPQETDAAILKQLAALDRRIKAKRGT